MLSKIFAALLLLVLVGLLFGFKTLAVGAILTGLGYGLTFGLKPLQTLIRYLLKSKQ